MLYYCLNCRKNAESKNPKVEKTNKGRIMLSPECAMCDSKKTEIYQRSRRLLSNLGLKTLSNKISLLGDILF